MSHQNGKKIWCPKKKRKHGVLKIWKKKLNMYCSCKITAASFALLFSPYFSSYVRSGRLMFGSKNPIHDLKNLQKIKIKNYKKRGEIMFFYNLRKFCVPKKSSKKMARMTQHSQKKWCKKKSLSLEKRRLRERKK